MFLAVKQTNIEFSIKKTAKHTTKVLLFFDLTKYF